LQRGSAEGRTLTLQRHRDTPGRRDLDGDIELVLARDHDDLPGTLGDDNESRQAEPLEGADRATVPVSARLGLVECPNTWRWLEREIGRRQQPSRGDLGGGEDFARAVRYPDQLTNLFEPGANAYNYYIKYIGGCEPPLALTTSAGDAP